MWSYISPAEVPQKVCFTSSVPVEAPASASASLPDPSDAQGAHERGECRPCAYFWHKGDGCRQGEACKFCHLCDPGAMKRWKQEKKQKMKRQARAFAQKNKNAAKKAASRDFALDLGEPMRVNVEPLSASIGATASSAPFAGRPYFPADVTVATPQVPLLKQDEDLGDLLRSLAYREPEPPANSHFNRPYHIKYFEKDASGFAHPSTMES